MIEERWMGNRSRAGILCLTILGSSASLNAHLLSVTQLTNQTPSDARSNQFDDPVGASWRVFAVDSHRGGPVAITEVEELRQQNPPSKWAISIRSRATEPVAFVGLAAAIVTGDGSGKAVQRLPAIRNLKPDQANRLEMRVTVTVLTPTDRVVFYVSEISDGGGVWKAADADVAALIKSAAKRLPIP
jgi:hypothetical protein